MPVDVADLDNLKGNPRDEVYPGIKICLEEPHQKYGLDNSPARGRGTDP